MPVQPEGGARRKAAPPAGDALSAEVPAAREEASLPPLARPRCSAQAPGPPTAWPGAVARQVRDPLPAGSAEAAQAPAAGNWTR